LRLAQEKGSWDNFTKDEIDKCCKHQFYFNKLIKAGDILDNENGTYFFTDYFIMEMYKYCKI